MTLAGSIWGGGDGGVSVTSPGQMLEQALAVSHVTVLGQGFAPP
jgi:hypothetical protein